MQNFNFIIFSFTYLLLTSFIGLSQNTIDSLKTIYPKQNNYEKSLTLCELSYQLSNNDTKTAIYYGELAFQAASATKDSSLIAQSLNDWSMAYLVKGDFDKVIRLNQEALNIRVQLGDSIGVGKSLNKMANAYYELGMMDEALTANLRAIKIFENNGLEAYMGQILVNIGVLYERNGMFNQAMENYRKGQKIAEINQNPIGYYNVLANEGNCLTKMGEYNKADSLMNEALTYYISEDNTDLIASMYQNLGVNARKNKQVKLGKQYYQKAYEMFQINNSEIGMSLVLVNLGEVYLELEEFDSAEFYLKNGLELSLKSNSFYQLKHVYQGLTQLENLRGDHQKANEYFDLYVTQMDSLYGEQTNTTIAEMQVKYDTDQKIKDLETEKLKSKNSQLWLTIATIIIVLLIVLMLFLKHRKTLQRESLKLEALEKIEKERNRIARDLHDNLGAELSLISAKIDIEAFKNKDKLIKKELEKISEISKNANHQLRETIWSIHKSSININELERKIQNYGDRIFENTPVNIAVFCENEEVNLNPALALHLFRICQESINNSFKYAQATQLSIYLKPTELLIKDNGIGFDPKTVSRGYGLNNIEERIKEIKGNFKLESNKQGTWILVNYSTLIS